MDEQERQQILALLEDGRDAVPAAVSGVSDQQASRIPAPGRWSILNCAEHIAVTEAYFLAQIRAATPAGTDAVNLVREAKMMARGTDRTRRMESPPEGHPTGKFPTMAAAVDNFLATRAQVIEFVRANQLDLRAHVTWHPVLKQANCHEMLLSVYLHAMRHVKQIEEIKAELAPRREPPGATTR